MRYLGTIGGNVANGDPGNDMPAVMMCLGATYQLAGKGGERRVAARDFYQGAYFTALEPGEILAAIRIPIPPTGHGYAYEKLKRKVGDYATAAAAVRSDDGGRTRDNLLDRPHQCRRDPALGGRRGAILVGSSLDPATVKRAVAAAEAITSPASDTRGPGRSIARRWPA